MRFKENIRDLIWRIFSPESRVEIVLRTFYHHVVATKIFTTLQIWDSKRSYQKWLRTQNEFLNEIHFDTLNIPDVTFIVRVLPKSIKNIQKTFQSIREQRSGDWYILFAYSDNKALDEHIKTLSQNDLRIKICVQPAPKLSLLINQCVSDYVVLCDAGDIFSPSFLLMFGQKHLESPSAAVYFSDVDAHWKDGKEARPFFRPDRLSPEFLLSTNYLSRSLIHKNIAKKVLSEIDLSLDYFEQEWNLLLLISKELVSFVHIPYVLVHISDIMVNYCEETKKAFFIRHSNSMSLIGESSDPMILGITLLTPKVSIIIPTINNLNSIETILDSIFSLTEYPNYEIILVDNESSDNNVISYYQKLSQKNNFRVLNYNEVFNYSRAVNLGASASDGELILFLNNDMKVINPAWLTELVKFVMIPEVGIVGPKLLRANHTIQHAGIVMGLQGFVGHVYLNAPEHYYGLTGPVDWTRNVSAVTGACQMMRREVFLELGGYDENFQLVFGDVDFCLRVLEHSYRIVYAPAAELIHYEGKSRGYQTPVKDLLRGYEKMAAWLEKDDPYFSPNLTYTPIPKCQFHGDIINSRLESIQNRKQAIEKSVRSVS